MYAVLAFVVILLIVGVVLIVTDPAGIIPGIGLVDSGSSNEPPTNNGSNEPPIFTIESQALIVLGLTGKSEGFLVPVIVSNINTKNQRPTTQWFSPGSLNGITPNYNTHTGEISLRVTREIVPKIQSITINGRENLLNPNYSMGVPIGPVRSLNYLPQGKVAINPNEELTEIKIFNTYTKTIDGDLTQYDNVFEEQSYETLRSLVNKSLMETKMSTPSNLPV